MQRRVYSVWQSESSVALVEGLGPPTLANGTVDDPSAQRLWTIEAASREEAMAIHHLRQGWEPYVPRGAARPCSGCGALKYVEGSGECWRCGLRG